MDILPGYKTYIAAAGLVALAAYQLFYLGDFATAMQSFLAALAALGIRVAMDRP